MITHTSRHSKIQLLLPIVIFCTFGGRLQLLAQTTPASSAPASEELIATLENNVRSVLQKPHRQRTAQELNAAGEAAYLMYSLKPSDDSLKSLTAHLSELWQDDSNYRQQSLRLSVLACQFNVATMDEIADLSRARTETNSLFSFFYSRRLLLSGQLTAAVNVMTNMREDVIFSTDEAIGFRDLLKLMQSNSNMSGDACAIIIWKAYSATTWVEFVNLIDVISGDQWRHVDMNGEQRGKLILARIRAASTLVNNGELIRSRFLGKVCLQDLHSELEIARRQVDLSDEDYNRYIAEIKKVSPEVDKLQTMIQKWVGFPTSSITGALAREMIEDGQCRVISRKLAL